MKKKTSWTVRQYQIDNAVRLFECGFSQVMASELSGCSLTTVMRHTNGARSKRLCCGNMVWLIVSDPTGLYEPGRWLDDSSVTATLRDKNFPVGMEMSRNGVLYRVESGPTRQVMVAV